MPLPHRAILISVVVLIAAPLAWRAGTRGQWTDGRDLRASDAHARDVLWTSAKPADAVLSVAADVYAPRVSADGLVMVMVRGRAGANADLYISHKTPQGWSEPEAITSINTPDDELAPAFSHDGRMLYFASNRPGGLGGFDLWVSHVSAEGWDAPTNLGPRVNSPWNDIDPCPDVAGDQLYFASNRPRAGEPEPAADAWPATLRERRNRHDYDLYSASLAEGSTEATVPLLSLNTRDDEGCPALSPAGDFLYFASDRPGGEGGFDLWRARLLDHNRFATPEHLDAQINTPANELDPTLSDEGFRLTFSSDRPGSAGTLLQTAPSDRPRRYALWTSTSREVFRERVAARGDLWPSIVIALATMAILLLLARLIASARWRERFFKLSLLAQCLILSLILHAAIASLLTVWRVGSGLIERAGASRGTRVILASTGAQHALADAVRATSESAAMPTPFLTLAPPPTPAIALTSPQPFALPQARIEPAPLSAPEPEARISPPAPSIQITTAPPRTLPSSTTPLPALAPAVRASDEPSPTPRLDIPQSPTSPTAFTPRTDALPLPPALATPAAPTTLLAPESALSTLPSPAAPPISPARARDAAPAAALPDPVSPALPQTAEPTLANSAMPAMPSPAPAPLALASAGSTPLPTLAPMPIAPSNSDRAPVSSEPSVSSAALPAYATAIEPTRDTADSRPALPALPATASSAHPSSEAGIPSASVSVPATPPTSIASPLPRTPDPLPLPSLGALASSSDSVPVGPAPSPSRASTAAASIPLPQPTPASAASGSSSRIPDEPVQPRENFAQRAPEVRQELLERGGGTADTERAVGRALEWLARHQSPDGRWSATHFDDDCGHCPNPAQIDSDASMTGLALLCFLGAGHTHEREGPYQANVRRALDWLTARQSEDGDLRRGETMYAQTVATVAMCEALAMTSDQTLALPTRRAVALVMDRAATGRPASDRDASVLGWLIFTLESARRAGIDVPRAPLDAAERWLDSVESPRNSGRYAYTRGVEPTAAMTAEALFVRQILGHDRESPSMRASSRFILRAPPRWGDGAPTHYWYYATLAMFQQQGPEWAAWNHAMVKELLEHQRTEGPAAGSWDPADASSRLAGRVYQTAICTLNLEVYYRYRAR